MAVTTAGTIKLSCTAVEACVSSSSEAHLPFCAKPRNISNASTLARKTRFFRSVRLETPLFMIKLHFITTSVQQLQSQQDCYAYYRQEKIKI